MTDRTGQPSDQVPLSACSDNIASEDARLIDDLVGNVRKALVVAHVIQRDARARGLTPAQEARFQELTEAYLSGVSQLAESASARVHNVLAACEADRHTTSQ